MEAARPATVDDLDRVLDLADAAIDELRPTRGGEMWARRDAPAAPRDTELRHALDDADALVLVGTIDGIVVGYATARAERLRDGAELAVLGDFYVEREARGVGVGEAMMERVVGWAEARGCIGIDAMALPGNRDAKNFFERFGLVARALVVHRPLGGTAR